MYKNNVKIPVDIYYLELEEKSNFKEWTLEGLKHALTNVNITPFLKDKINKKIKDLESK